MTDRGFDSNELLRRFEQLIPRFEEAAEHVVEILNDVLAGAGIYATVTSRVKDLASFRGKIELKTHYTDPWHDITDKVGARVIVHHADQVDQIRELILADGRLPISAETDKRKGLGEKEFGYSGLHLDVLAPEKSGDEELIGVEIQVRTIAQHAWSEVSHRLLYKPAETLEQEDRRAIWRLVALVEVFDGEVSRVINKLPPPGAKSAGAPETVDLPQVLSSQYSRFEATLGDPEMTDRVCGVIAATLQSDLADYPTMLNMWVARERDWLRQVFDDYGPRSEMASSADYVLWSQPESIAILEALANRPWALLSAWREDGLPDRWLRPFEAVGTELDLFA